MPKSVWLLVAREPAGHQRIAKTPIDRAQTVRDGELMDGAPHPQSPQRTT
jgi:hypothetical protein